MKTWSPRKFRILKTDRPVPLSNGAIAEELWSQGLELSEQTVWRWSTEGSPGPRIEKHAQALAAVLGCKTKDLYE